MPEKKRPFFGDAEREAYAELLSNVVDGLLSVLRNDKILAHSIAQAMQDALDHPAIREKQLRDMRDTMKTLARDLTAAIEETERKRQRVERLLRITSRFGRLSDMVRRRGNGGKS